MREGLDLRGDLARFQLITAVPRGDISDPATARQVERAPQDYEWDTLRELIQASGRVCRGADDWGVTVIADSSASRELSSGLLPPSWAEAVTRIE
jgi:Rad3-related DNA helicase